MQMIDTAEIQEQTDLRALLTAELGEPSRSGFWLCPFHDERTPSFGIVKKTPHLWHCFSCGRSGDAIKYLRDRHGLSFRDACERLSDGRLPETLSRPLPPSRPKLRQAEPVAATWASRAAEAAAAARRCLWTPAGRPGREYLRGRGIAEDTSKAAGLGWLPADLRDDPALWGLEPDSGDVWTPAGLMIPWRASGKLCRLNVRRLDGDPKYIGPRGWTACLYATPCERRDLPAILCEGELDALRIWQAVGDTAQVFATGSTTGARTARSLYRLAVAPRLALLFDGDKAGRAAADYWMHAIPDATAVALATGHDDPASMEPGALRALLSHALPGWTPKPTCPPPLPLEWDSFDQETLEELCRMTVDNAMSDVEALRVLLHQPSLLAGIPVHPTEQENFQTDLINSPENHATATTQRS